MFSSDDIPTVLKNYSAAITEPSRQDVLCGKDTTLARHHGNQVFRAKIQSMLPGYLKARSKQDKMKITKSIVQFITIKQGSRFLKQKNNGDWIEIDSQAARDKVSHALRFAARQQQKTGANDKGSDETCSHGGSDDASSSTSSSDDDAPPPPVPSRGEIERNATDVSQLFAAFDHPLTGGILASPEPLEVVSREPLMRRESARLLMSFLSTVDFEDEVYDIDGLTAQTFSFDAQERQFLGMGSSHEEFHEQGLTQWAAC